jgi:hypothetical protein
LIDLNVADKAKGEMVQAYMQLAGDMENLYLM